MAFTLDNATQGTYGSDAPFEVTHTTSADADLLVAVLFINGDTARTGGAPTYNGDPLTDSGEGFVVHTECGVEVWYLLDPDAGSNTLSVPNTGAVNLDVSVMTFEASSTNTAALDAANSATGTTEDPSLSLSVVDNALIVGAVGSGDRDDANAGSNFTIVHQYDAGNQTWASERWLDAGSSGSKTVDFDTARADDWGLIGISFKEVAAGTEYQQSCGGATDLSGDATPRANKVTAGSLTGVGGLTKKTTLTSFLGSLGLAGSTIKKAVKSFTGSLGLSGIANGIKTAFQVVGGVLGLSGIATPRANKVMAGSLTGVGGLVKQTNKVFSLLSLEWAETQPAGDADKFWECSSVSDDGLVMAIAASISGRLYVSTNGGDSWSEAQPAGDVNKSWYDVKVSGDGNVIIAVNAERFYISTNSGTNWSELQPLGDVNANWRVCGLDYDGSVIYGAIYNGRDYLSVNSGSDWNEVQPVGDINSTSQDVEMDSDGSVIMVLGSYVIAVSTNTGSDWTTYNPMGESFQSYAVGGVSADGSIMLVGISDSDGRLFLSTNTGSNWSEVQPFGDVDKRYQSVAISNDGSLMVVGLYAGRMVASFNTGDSWTETQPSGDYDEYWYAGAMDADGSHILFADFGDRAYLGEYISGKSPFTPVGTLIKKTLKSFTGSLTPSGIANGIKVAFQVVGGAIGLAGSLVKKTLKTIGGSLGLAGNAAQQYIAGVIQQAVGGVINFTGTVARKTSKLVAGATDLAGSLVKKTSKAFTGLIGLAGQGIGQLTGLRYQIVGGVIGLTGTITKKTSKAFTGALELVGTVTKKIAKAFTGVIDFIGSLWPGKLTYKAEILEFDLELNKTVPWDATVNKVVAMDLELNKVVEIDDYEEMEDYT